MSVALVDSPQGRLCRVGRAPDPFAWPPSGIDRAPNRYDDPLGRVRTQYAAELRRGAFVEVLARFRAPLDVVARLQRQRSEENTVPPPPDLMQEVNRVPDDWHLKRHAGLLQLEPNQRWLDARAPQTLTELRAALAEIFVTLGLADFDISDILGRNRSVTQAVAQWAVTQGLDGIVYKSRLPGDYICWAIFEGSHFTTSDVSPISRDDPDLVAAAAELGLRL